VYAKERAKAKKREQARITLLKYDADGEGGGKGEEDKGAEAEAAITEAKRVLEEAEQDRLSLGTTSAIRVLPLPAGRFDAPGVGAFDNYSINYGSRADEEAWRQRSLAALKWVDSAAEWAHSIMNGSRHELGPAHASAMSANHTAQPRTKRRRLVVGYVSSGLGSMATSHPIHGLAKGTPT
jgi:hypothetical protein